MPITAVKSGTQEAEGMREKSGLSAYRHETADSDVDCGTSQAEVSGICVRLPAAAEEKPQAPSGEAWHASVAIPIEAP
jgi:hypothetical protein